MENLLKNLDVKKTWRKKNMDKKKQLVLNKTLAYIYNISVLIFLFSVLSFVFLYIFSAIARLQSRFANIFGVILIVVLFIAFFIALILRLYALDKMENNKLEE